MNKIMIGARNLSRYFNVMVRYFINIYRYQSDPLFVILESNQKGKNSNAILLFYYIYQYRLIT